MDWKALAAKAAGLADDLLPILETVAGPQIGAAIEIGRTVLDLGHKIKDVAGADAASLDAALPALEARVVALAKQEAAALRGG